MAKKKGAGGKPRNYEEKNGQYAKELVSAIKKFSSEPERDIVNANIPNKNGRINKNSLTNQEWALWYKTVGKNKKLGY